MKRKHYLILDGLLFCAIILFYACGKKDKPQPENVSPLKAGKLQTSQTIQIAENDTIHIREADSIFNLAKQRGLTTVLGSRYLNITPHYNFAILYFLYDNMVSLYVPLGYDPMTGRLLKMIILKERGIKRVIFTEHEPTAAWRQTNSDYSGLTGTVRFYRLNGTTVKAYQLVNGAATAIIPVGGGTSSISLKNQDSEVFTANSAGHPEGWEDEDDDFDGVSNKDDRCPSTPAGVMVDAKGCPLVITIDVVEIRADPDDSDDYNGSWGFPTIWPPYEPGFPAPPPPEVIFPGDMGGSPVPPLSGTNGTKNGNMCGSYDMKTIGGSNNTQINMLGGSYIEKTTQQRIPVVFAKTCITVTIADPVRASHYIVDNWNWVTAEVNRMLNNREIDATDVALRAATKSLMNAALSSMAWGSKFTEGECQGIGPGVPVSDAKYFNPVTGRCE